MFLAAVCFISGCSRSGCGGTAAEGSTKPKECVGLPPLAAKASYAIGFVQLHEPGNAYTIANTESFVHRGEETRIPTRL